MCKFWAIFTLGRFRITDEILFIGGVLLLKIIYIKIIYFQKEMAKWYIYKTFLTT